MRSGHRLWVGLAAALTLGGCDATVGLDSTKLTLTDIIVPGACPAPGADDLSLVDVSVILLNGKSSILPDDKIQRDKRPVREILGPDAFTWSILADADFAGSSSDSAVARGLNTGNVAGVQLSTVDVNFRYNGGEERKDDRRLVLFLVDHSGSLLGRDPRNGIVDATKASDDGDSRLRLFEGLLSALPDRDQVSLVAFNKGLPIIVDNGPDGTPGVSRPTPNRTIIADGLRKLQRGEEGGTPLASTLLAAQRRIIEAYTDFNPIVVLFTDGVEEGDTSDDEDRSVLREAIDLYEAKNIPVIVVQLKPSINSEYSQTRDPLLVELACRTKGEYIFIEDASQITKDSDVRNVLARRIEGSWVVRAQTTMSNPSFEADEYLLSTQLTVNLGSVKSEALSKKRDSVQNFLDNRLWFLK